MAALPPNGLVDLRPANDAAEVPAALRAIEGPPVQQAGTHFGSHLDLAGLEFGRLAALGHFWARDNVRELVARWEEALTGLHAFGKELVFCVLNREGRDLEYLTAFADRDAQVGTLLAALKARLPGSDIDLVDDVRARAYPANAVLEAPSWTGLLGVPDVRPALRGTDSGLLASLIRALGTRPWGLLVFADPRDQCDVDPTLQALSDEVRTVSPWTEQSVTGVLGMTGHEQNPLVAHYVDLLQAEFRRLAEGRPAGLWTVRTYFFAGDEDAAAVFRAAALGTAGGAKVARPLRVVPCAPPGCGGDGDVATVLTGRELAVLTRPSAEEAPGLPVRDHAVFDTHAETAFSGDAGDRGRIVLGEVLGREGVEVDIPASELARHALVVGITGSGKTTAVWSLLDQLSRLGPAVPFLVIEPAKHEYRSLPLKEPLRVYTMGDESTAPLRLNPFEVPDGILVQTHIDHLNALFRASFALYPPMPYVLERCLYEIYTDRGWDLASNKVLDTGNAPGVARFPTLRDLGRKVEEVSGRLGYGAEVTMNVRAALLTRIDTLRMGAKGMMLDTEQAFDAGEFLSRPTIVELERVGNDEEKAFLMGLLLTRVFEHRQAQGSTAFGGEALHHVTVVEEAHRLLRNRVPSADPESADPAAHAVEQFANMLAEVRSLGEGIVVAEQIPAKLAPDVVKNTSLKIVFRLVAEDDKRSVGSSINLDDDQARVLTSLPRGEALVFREGMDGPIRVHAPGMEVRRAAASVDDVALRTRMEGLGAIAPAAASSAVTRRIATRAAALVGSAGFGRLFLHWALASAFLDYTGEGGRLRDRVRAVSAADQPAGVSPCEWLAAVLEAAADELPGRLEPVDRAAAAARFARFSEDATTSRDDPADYLRAAGRRLGDVVRSVAGGRPRPFAGCRPVCPVSGCPYRVLAAGLVDQAFARAVRSAVFDAPAGTAPRLLLAVARDAGARVLTDVGSGAPSLVGGCAIVQCLSREVGDAVVEDTVLETLRVAAERGYL